MIFCLFMLDLLGFGWSGGELDRVGERWCGDGVFCYGFGVGVWVGNS